VLTVTAQNYAPQSQDKPWLWGHNSVRQLREQQGGPPAERRGGACPAFPLTVNFSANFLCVCFFSYSQV